MESIKDFDLTIDNEPLRINKAQDCRNQVRNSAVISHNRLSNISFTKRRRNSLSNN